MVVEARERSGALITADFALELGRDVFAVPGEITSGLSKGTNDLIRQGAAPMLAVDDVLEALGRRARRRRSAGCASRPRPSAVLAFLVAGAASLDEISHGDRRRERQRSPSR